MNQILALREKRASLWDAAKKYRDAHIGSDGTMTAEDAATYDRMVDDVDRMKKEIDRLERQEAIENEMNRPVSQPIVNRPDDGQPKEKEKRGTATDAYKTAFWNMVRAKAMSYEIHNALKIGEDDHGGYLAPDEFECTLVEALEEQNIFRQFAHVITTSSGDRKIPVVASKGTASWIDEEAAFPESDDTFGMLSIGAFKLATTIKVSDELLHDSVFDVASYIAKEFARRIGAAEEEAFFTGNGTGRPTGILNATGGAETGVTSAGANISFDDVIDLYYSLRSPYRRNAVFMMNDSTVRALRKLKNGSGDYLWQPSVTAGTPDTILNRPVYTSSYMPTVAAGAKSILFGDMSYYWIADREGRTFQRLNELYAPTGQVGFLSFERVDGKLILPEAAKVLQMKS
ncbi:MAG: phage major capsid protein [Aristaeellaceae bacterium]